MRLKNRPPVIRAVPLMLVAAFLVGLASLPALANHVAEPTRPIVQLSPNNYPYPVGANRVQDCASGTEEYPWGDFVRTEPTLLIETNWPNRADPSEHYSVTYEMLVTATIIQPDGSTVTRLVKREGGHWQHQNTAAHERNGQEIVQWNAWLLPNGPVVFNWRAVGLISGNTLHANCTFTITGSPVQPYVIDLRAASPSQVTAFDQSQRG